jgi:nucleotide-binding universal stress UspA family protein
MGVLKRILIPLDGSACASHAFDYALRLAKAEAAALYLCSVVNPAALVGRTPTAPLEDERVASAVADAEIALGAAAQKAAFAGVPTGKHVRLGEPGPTIVACAAEMKADTIVMGTHGCSGLKRLFMGSVAEFVLRAASCPVVTVRESISAERERGTSPVADQTTPVCVMRLIEVGPAEFERLYGEIASFMSGPGAELSGVLETEVFGSEDRRRIAIVAHFASRQDWVRAQWDACMGELLEEIAANSETLEFDLFHSDRFARSPVGSHASS